MTPDQARSAGSIVVRRAVLAVLALAVLTSCSTSGGHSNAIPVCRGVGHTPHGDFVPAGHRPCRLDGLSAPNPRPAAGATRRAPKAKDTARPKPATGGSDRKQRPASRPTKARR